jgi:hypothetical protein
MSVASRHISEEVNKKRQQIRKGIEDYIKYIDLHITLQRKLKTLCCGSENLDVNDVGAIFAWLDTAIRDLTKQINEYRLSDDHPKKKTIIEENQKQSLQQFRIRLLDYQTSQQRYGRLGNIPDKLDESHIIDLLQKRYNRLLKTPNEPLLETVQHFISSHDEDNNDNQGDRQIDYLYIWMSLIFFSLINQLKDSLLLGRLNDEQILDGVSFVVKQEFKPSILSSTLEDMIYDKEKQFSHNITPKSGGNRKKKYSRHRPSRKSSAIKRRSRRPPPPHITQTNIKQFSHYVS